jgi:SP family facilitated glucose transporter-like MFS transporter 8
LIFLSYLYLIHQLAGAAGSPVLGQVSDYFGLQKSLLIATVPLLLGWLLITFATNLPMILVGRFITGFFVSGVGVSNPLVAEYSKAKRRGRLNFIFDLMFCAGVLYIYIIGTFLNWRWQAGLCGLICVLFFLLLFFYVPESPAHLVRKKQNGGAEKGLMRMRDLNANDVTTELDHVSHKGLLNINGEIKESYPRWRTLSVSLKFSWI